MGLMKSHKAKDTGKGPWKHSYVKYFYSEVEQLIFFILIGSLLI